MQRLASRRLLTALIALATVPMAWAQTHTGGTPMNTPSTTQENTSIINAKLRLNNIFLQNNGKQPGVTTLGDGLQYKVLTQGSGPRAAAATTPLKLNYEGRLINGQVFDSSYQRGTPAVFSANQVIPGFGEALMLMPEGSTWEIYIPSALAYGKNGVPNSPIGPNEVLIFKIHMIKVQ